MKVSEHLIESVLDREFCIILDGKELSVLIALLGKVTGPSSSDIESFAPRGVVDKMWDELRKVREKHHVIDKFYTKIIGSSSGEIHLKPFKHIK